MLRTRVQGDDMFRWARTEMKRELVMSQSSYAKLAGLQSEVGRVVVTRVAGSELEYKRTLNSYRRDVRCAVNNIRREQIKMRMKLGRYVRKLKQTRLEHVKLVKEHQRRDRERAMLEELHLRLKFEAAAKTPEPVEPPIQVIDTDNTDGHENKDTGPVSPPVIDFRGEAIFLQTGMTRDAKVKEWQDKKNEGDNNTHPEHENDKQTARTRKPSTAFNPMLPMIDEDEKEADEVTDDTEKQTTQTEQTDKFDLRVWDEMSVSSYGGRIKRKNDVSFSDIIKVKYTGTKKMFDLVHKLARKHGIPDVVEEVPDPRDNVVLRGSTNDSFRLQAAVLYPMKYGYDPDAELEEVDRRLTSSKSPAMTSVSDVEKTSESRVNSTESKRLRKVSVDSRRSLYLSGKYSRSIDADTHDSLSERSDSPRKLKSRDLSMPELVDRVSRIKIEKADRLSSSSKLENEMISHYNLLTPSYKPSSSRSSRSLPVISKDSERDNSNNNVTWTQALGLLRAVHSLEDVSN